MSQNDEIETQADLEREARKEPDGSEDYCTDCKGKGLTFTDVGQAAPCPYCRPADARKWADACEYDPREDADSELVGNPPEEPVGVEELIAIPRAAGPETPADDVRDVLALEEATDDELAWLLTWAENARLRGLVEAERNTRAVERAAAEAQRYLDANEGGWALPNREVEE
jgi:hypothetical protein